MLLNLNIRAFIFIDNRKEETIQNNAHMNWKKSSYLSIIISNSFDEVEWEQTEEFISKERKSMIAL